MEPINIECSLRCPKHGEDAIVTIECTSGGDCCVTRCTHFGDNPVICSQDCLEGVTHGTHWDGSDSETLSLPEGPIPTAS